MTLMLFFTLGLNLLWLAIPGNKAQNDRFNPIFRLPINRNHTSYAKALSGDHMRDKQHGQITTHGHVMEDAKLTGNLKVQKNKHSSTQNPNQVTLLSLEQKLPSPTKRTDLFQYKHTTKRTSVKTDKPIFADEEKRVTINDQMVNRFHHTEEESKTTTASWCHWGPCSATCGTGAQERSRTCGPNCQEVESRECYLRSCHGIMSGMEFTGADLESKWTPSSGNHSHIEDKSFLDTDIDACTMWSSCKDAYLQQYMSQLTDLPNCPCYLPFNLHRDNNVWDDASRRFYKWVEVNSTEEKLSVYRPDAYKCVRSLLFPGASTLASQICCYSFNLKLITRGRNAGTVNLISPQISWELHYKIDILPWVICKGDWTRYNRVLPPNNMLECHENPNEETLLEEIKDARDY